MCLQERKEDVLDFHSFLSNREHLFLFIIFKGIFTRPPKGSFAIFGSIKLSLWYKSMQLARFIGETGSRGSPFFKQPFQMTEAVARLCRSLLYNDK